jgi:hypothetical protein
MCRNRRGVPPMVSHSHNLPPCLALLNLFIRSAFYYPMVGFINMFISVLKLPGLPSAQSDVALLDVVAGHFGHMDFITSSELAFPFTTEVAALARATVKKAKSKCNATNLPPTAESAQFELDRNALIEVNCPFSSPTLGSGLDSCLSCF